MLGLADRSRILDLFEHVARGAIKEALDGLSELYALGTEPEAVLQDLLEISHWLTRIKVAPEAARAFGVAQQDVLRGQELAGALSMPVLARAWQMLLKGIEDVRLAPSPLLATEMVLVRLAYAADLPPPSELLSRVSNGAETGAPDLVSQSRPETPATPMHAMAQEPPGSPGSFAEAVALFERFGEPMLHGWLYQTAQLVHFEPGRIQLRLAGRTPPDLPGRVAAALQRWTGQTWLVSVVDDDQPAAPTLAEQAAAARRARIDAAAEDPRIKPVLQQFPGAAVVDVRPAAAR
jgi:DNA polymerase III subunit gamma/tau